MHANIVNKYSSFYFIGIGGVSMSGIAKYLLMLGKKVGGSDALDNEYTEELLGKGIKINFGNQPDDIENYEYVIFTDAISDGDARLRKALELSKPTVSRGQFLYEISRSFNTVIAVSGCHGKTTCTAMLAHIFSAADKKFTSHIGGKDLTFSNFYHCGYDYFITEACEYKKNFLRLKPDVSVILNSDPDHIECYGSEQALKCAYIKFSALAKQTVSLYRDIDVDGISFGFDRRAEYYAKNIKSGNGICAFTAYERGEKLGEIQLNVYGRHNVLNALACIAVARYFGLPFGIIRSGLGSFKGVERRFERIGQIGGALYYADYAHHPDELKASLKTARKITEGKLYVVFQPHTYSRTRLLFNSFVKVLNPLGNLLVYKTFPAREYYDDAGSALTLSQKIKRARYGDSVADICDFVSGAKAGDTVLFLGAGDIYYIAKRICADRLEG